MPREVGARTRHQNWTNRRRQRALLTTSAPGPPVQTRQGPRLPHELSHVGGRLGAAAPRSEPGLRAEGGGWGCGAAPEHVPGRGLQLGGRGLGKFFPAACVSHPYHVVPAAPGIEGVTGPFRILLIFPAEGSV
ncbi:uncharacterized protein LOC114206475 [Eumetopias jubatus]|uniref:uncharacterized protein LOC114206475 n=1 Tax=Eumetopias jubatus TaxID=34886 RepID=UPI001016CB0C|nr:uncharacterized protein LOC114206475 [Eumetopias jubatus]